jgi:hypothetical protein
LDWTQEVDLPVSKGFRADRTQVIGDVIIRQVTPENSWQNEYFVEVLQPRMSSSDAELEVKIYTGPRKCQIKCVDIAQDLTILLSITEYVLFLIIDSIK